MARDQHLPIGLLWATNGNAPSGPSLPQSVHEADGNGVARKRGRALIHVLHLRRPSPRHLLRQRRLDEGVDCRRRAHPGDRCSGCRCEGPSPAGRAAARRSVSGAPSRPPRRVAWALFEALYQPENIALYHRINVAAAALSLRWCSRGSSSRASRKAGSGASTPKASPRCSCSWAPPRTASSPRQSRTAAKPR